MDLIALAIPAFFVIIGVELVASLLLKRRVYRLNDSINDLSTGILREVFRLFWLAGVVGIYTALYVATAVWELKASDWWTWAIALIGVDLGYYWFHRLSHRVSFMWGGHVVHHQSEEYNYTVALRQSSIEPLMSWPFYLPLAVIGVPPVVYAAADSINTIFQFWVHTRLIPKLGPIGWLFNTPSHHRVHHGCDPKYLDRNYSGMFILWDRLFGTFQPEEEEPTYGTVKPLRSWNPLWANIDWYVTVWRQARSFPRLTDRLKVWFMPPGWTPEQPVPEPIEVLGRERYDAGGESGVGAYVFAQFVLVLAAAVVLLFGAEQLPRLHVVLLALFVTWSLVNLGGIWESKRSLRWAEGLRLTVAAPLAWVVGGGPAAGICALVAAGSLGWFLGRVFVSPLDRDALPAPE